jgi:hypothetical protein
MNLIYVLGELRDVRAAPWLAEHIDFKAPRLDPAFRKARWGEYPAAEALTKIGPMALREISSKLPKDQTELRRKLMISVIRDVMRTFIRDVQGESCGRIVLEDAFSSQSTDAAKANLKLSLEAYDALAKPIQKK